MVSVIVPIYNSEKTLPACIRSILNQTYRDYELILIDDGSTDRGGQICDELQEKCLAQNRPCRVVHQQNRGVSAARNRGLDLASGQYFVFIDSDDVVEPCYLEDLVRTAEDHPEFGHVICGFRCTSHEHDYVFSKAEPLSVVDRKEYMLLSHAILIQGPVLALYRTEIAKKYGVRMRENMSLAEDTLFNLDYLDALENTTIGVVNKTNYIYQDEAPDSLYHRYRPDMLAVHELVNGEIRDALERWGVEQEAWNRYYNAVFSTYLGILDNTFHAQNPMTHRERIAYNSMVLKRDGFRDAMKKMTLIIPAAMRNAYETGDYRCVLLQNRIRYFKRSVLKILKKQR